MALKTLTLLFAASGIAAVFYRAGQRAALAGPEPQADDPSLDPGERKQDLQLANAGMGTNANEHNEDLLTPPRGDEQQAENIKPGLPDFARGA